ncbi:unnamed protein product, partial [Prorocentrum cordatum]
SRFGSRPSCSTSGTCTRLVVGSRPPEPGPGVCGLKRHHEDQQQGCSAAVAPAGWRRRRGPGAAPPGGPRRARATPLEASRVPSWVLASQAPPAQQPQAWLAGQAAHPDVPANDAASPHDYQVTPMRMRTPSPYGAARAHMKPPV